MDSRSSRSSSCPNTSDNAEAEVLEQLGCRCALIAARDVKLVSVLGEGAYARVHRARCRGTTVAAKVYSLDKCPDPRLFVPEFLERAQAHAAVAHPHIAALMGVACDPQHNTYVLVTELCERSLADALFAPQAQTASEQARPLSLQARMRLALQIARGMAWLHTASPALVHGRLKPANVLLKDNDSTCVISDVSGSASSAAATAHAAATPEQTSNLAYIAPEVLLGGPPTPSSDVYSFGVLLWELVHRKRVFDAVVGRAQQQQQPMPAPPLPRRTPEEAAEASAAAAAAFMQALCDNKEVVRPSLEECPPHIAPLVERCWAADASARPSFEHDIVPAMERIVLETAIPDARARGFWASTFGDEGAPAVPWKKLKAALLESKLYEDIVAQERRRRRLRGKVSDAACAPIFWIKSLVCSGKRDDDMVAAEEFGRLFSAFGPAPAADGQAAAAPMHQGGMGVLEAVGMMAGNLCGPDAVALATAAAAAAAVAPGDTQTLVSRLKRTLRAEWFHGDLDTPTATKILHADGREGAFLVRFSSTDHNLFTLSRLTTTPSAQSGSKRGGGGGPANTDVSHIRIPNQIKGLYIRGMHFQSMPDVVARLAKALRLKHPVKSHTYAAAVQLWALKKKKKRGTRTPASAHLQYVPSPSTSPGVPKLMPSPPALLHATHSAAQRGTSVPNFKDDELQQLLLQQQEHQHFRQHISYTADHHVLHSPLYTNTAGATGLPPYAHSKSLTSTSPLTMSPSPTSSYATSGMLSPCWLAAQHQQHAHPHQQLMMQPPCAAGVPALTQSYTGAAHQQPLWDASALGEAVDAAAEATRLSHTGGFDPGEARPQVPFKPLL